MRNPSSCRAFLSAFDETIATHPRSIAGATFLLCLACTAVAFLVTGIRVSTEGLCLFSCSLVVVLFFFRIERDSLDIFGKLLHQLSRTRAILILSLSLSLLAKTTTTTQDGTCEERSFRTDLYSLKRSWNPGDVPTARVT